MITKLNLGFFFFFFFLLFSPFLRGQTQQFVLKDAKVNESIKEKINANVEEYEIFELNLSAIDSYLKSYTSDKEIPFKITIAPGRTVELKLIENEIRAPNYTHLVVKEKYTELVPKGRCNTYKSVDKTNGMRPTLFSSSKYFSLSFFENGERKTLVSLSRFVNTDSLKKLKNIVVLYKDSHWKKLAKDCPSIEIDTSSISSTANNNASEAIRFLELAVVVDHEYVTNNSTPIDEYMNIVVVRYEDDFQLHISIVYLEIFDDVPSNYPFSCNLVNRWDQLKSYFNPVTSPQGTNPPSSYAGLRACVPRDLVHLFTYNEGDVAGTSRGNSLSHTGFKSICGTDNDTYLSLGAGFCEDRTGFAYSVSNGHALNWTTTAHEIGHNFGAAHTTCGIMCASYCPCSPEQFSSPSFSAINGHIYGTGVIPYACPPHRYGDCLLNVPIEPSQVDVLGPDIVCNGSATFSTNTNVWAIWDTDDPDVSLPIVRVDYTMTAYCSTPGGHSIKLA